MWIINENDDVNVIAMEVVMMMMVMMGVLADVMCHQDTSFHDLRSKMHWQKAEQLNHSFLHNPKIEVR